MLNQILIEIVPLVKKSVLYYNFSMHNLKDLSAEPEPKRRGRKPMISKDRTNPLFKSLRTVEGPAPLITLFENVTKRDGGSLTHTMTIAIMLLLGDSKSTDVSVAHYNNIIKKNVTDLNREEVNMFLAADKIVKFIESFRETYEETMSTERNIEDMMLRTALYVHMYKSGSLSNQSNLNESKVFKTAPYAPNEMTGMPVTNSNGLMLRDLNQEFWADIDAHKQSRKEVKDKTGAAKIVKKPIQLEAWMQDLVTSYGDANGVYANDIMLTAIFYYLNNLQMHTVDKLGNREETVIEKLLCFSYEQVVPHAFMMHFKSKRNSALHTTGSSFSQTEDQAVVAERKRRERENLRMERVNLIKAAKEKAEQAIAETLGADPNAEQFEDGNDATADLIDLLERIG